MRPNCRVPGFEDSPVKFAPLVFFEEFNGASKGSRGKARENRKEEIENRSNRSGNQKVRR
jgi:hypothetical protein